MAVQMQQYKNLCILLFFLLQREKRAPSCELSRRQVGYPSPVVGKPQQLLKWHKVRLTLVLLLVIMNSKENTP